MENAEKELRGFFVEKGSFFAHAAVTVLVISIAARLLGTMTLWGDMPSLIGHVLLPVGCSLLFILFILLLGRIALWTTILPVLGGAAFFILAVFAEGPGWPLFVCIALAFLAAFLYTATLLGMLRSKWLLVLVFLLIFAYQVVFRAIPVFSDTRDPVGFSDGMKLLSSMGMVFAMFCAALSFKRRLRPESEPELPKIKDPVVVAPAGIESVQGFDSAEEAPAEEATAQTAADSAEEMTAPEAADAAEADRAAASEENGEN